MSETPLRRLGFVQQGASYAYSYTGTAEKLYKTVRSFAPTFVEPHLANLEDKAVAITAPVVAQVQDLSEKALHIADDQVDCLLSTADKAVAGSKKGVADSLTGVKEMHEKNMQAYQAASNSYFEYIKGISDWAKDKLNPIKGGQLALDTLNAAIAKAQEATDPDVAAKMAMDAWSQFASVPVVAKVLETADPVTQSGLSSFYKLHDTLVSWPLYSKVVATGVSTLSWAATTTPYKLGAQYMYPLVKPVADPALAKLTNSKVIADTLDYWKPTASAA
ncbi:hypothetical protein QJQ45_002709 [Haematococcus lacustris]|nr:hypothetical protein QJQ45_002709 [Haematococcus lacustris]